jgi:hypothetical protein
MRTVEGRAKVVSGEWSGLGQRCECRICLGGGVTSYLTGIGAGYGWLDRYYVKWMLMLDALG